MSHSSRAPLLRLDRFGVAFGRTEVFDALDLETAHTGATAVMGPGGAGKSTLLRTLAGLNDAQPSFRTWGSAHYGGAPLGRRARPAIVGQSARLLMADALENVAIGLPARSAMTRREQLAVIASTFAQLRLAFPVERLGARVVDLSLEEQRSLALARAYVSDAPLILADEPTAGLDESGRARVLALLSAVAQHRALLWVTHDQVAAREVGGQVALLVGGRFVEVRDAHDFFGAPSSAEAARFVETGTCYALPESSETTARTGDQRTTRPPSGLSYLLNARIPRGLVWVYPGRLAGVPRPGLLEDLESDVAGLSSLGVDLLVCLEEHQTVPTDVLRLHGIASLVVPIEDMGIPSVEAALGLSMRVAAALDAGSVVAMHCRAGLGRTGTMLAAFLIWEGAHPLEALERVRSLQPRFVQSQAQVEFLAAFASAVAHARPTRRDPTSASR